ncbi:MAG: hypothetical protein ABFS23_12045 [Pseudomonadota bacterium]
MYLLPADYAIELPATPRRIKPVVYRQRMGFEVNALRSLSFHAAREMNWLAELTLPASGYLFVEKRHDPDSEEQINVVVGAAFFAQEVEQDIDAEWFMTAVWLHPAARGNGLYLRALPEMEDAFGHFAICGPYSDGFRALMDRHPEVAAHAKERLQRATG